MKRARDFFTAGEREKISKAVLAAEKQTSGEIVPVVATISGRYHRSEDVGGLLVGLALLTVVWIRFQMALPVQGDWGHGYKLTVGLVWALLCVVVGFMLGVGIATRTAWLVRILTPRHEMQEEVERAARSAFEKFRVSRL